MRASSRTVRVSATVDELAKLVATDAEVVKRRLFVSLKQGKIAGALGLS